VQSMADRYTYIPSIGLFIMACWGFSEVVEWLKNRIQSRTWLLNSGMRAMLPRGSGQAERVSVSSKIETSERFTRESAVAFLGALIAALVLFALALCAHCQI